MSTTTTERPAVLPVDFGTIPQELRPHPQFVNWRFEWRNEKWTKVPVNPSNGRNAKTNKSDTWRDLDLAQRYYERNRSGQVGIGFMLAKDDPFAGVDLDDCRDPETGTLEPWAAGIVQSLNSYTEISQSGTGVHILVRGKLPPGRRRTDGIEMYDSVRLFCMTGRRLAGTPATIEDRQEALEQLHAQTFDHLKPTSAPRPVPQTPSNHDDNAVFDRLMKAKNGDRFARLWHGDANEYRDSKSGKVDDSRADLALCSMISFYTQDRAQIDRLFRQSALHRDKWDERRGQQTYGEMTISRALDRSEFYEWDPPAFHFTTPNGHDRATTSPAAGDLLSKYVPTDDEEGEPGVEPFPVDALPEPLRSLVRAGAATLGAPPEFVAVPLLAMTGGVIGNAHIIELKPGYVQPANLTAAIVGPPGSIKSPALDVARRPLDQLQVKAFDEYEDLLSHYRSELSRWEQADERDRGEKPQEPRLSHYYTMDATLEALSVILAHERGVTLIQDELVTWVKSCDAYRGGRGGDRQKWLTLWSGAPLKIDRKTQKTTFIPRPVVSVVGTVQPDMLSELAQEAGRRDGFLERILWAWPKTPPLMWTEEELDPQTITKVAELFQRMRRNPDGSGPVKLGAAAKQRWIYWHNENAGFTGEASDLLAGFYSKLPNQLARIVLILHCVKHWQAPHTERVEDDTMRDAIRIVEYFRHHAHRVLPVFGSAMKPVPAGGLRERIHHILTARGDWVGRAEIYTALHNNVSTDSIRAVLDQLHTEALIEMRKQTPEGGIGRPREEWRLVSTDERRNVESKNVRSHEGACRVCGAIGEAGRACSTCGKGIVA